MESISTLKIDHEDWLKARQCGIGGSDAAAICGLDTFRTPLDVYEDKTADKPVRKVKTNAMEAGIRLEDTVAKWWADDNGFKIQKDNKIRVHQKHSFFLANIDRLILSQNGEGPGILEATTTNQWAYKSWEDDGAPMYKYCQIQHYFNVTGHKWGAIAVLVGGSELKSIDVKPNPEFITMMEEKLIDFWVNHVVPRIPPDPISSDDIKKLYPVSDPLKEIEATGETYELLQEVLKLEEQRKLFEGKEKSLKVRLKAVFQDAEIMTFEGGTVATFKTSKERNTFNKKMFGGDYPELLTKYTEQKPGNRVLLLK